MYSPEYRYIPFQTKDNYINIHGGEQMLSAFYLLHYILFLKQKYGKIISDISL